MHNAALSRLGLDSWCYQRLPVPPQLFEQTVRALAMCGFAGANVTIPHKHAALLVCDEPSRAAREIGAANTLTFHPDGSIAAENTDAPGLLAAYGRSPSGITALVLGAGGSARAVAWALARAGAGEVSVWNRTPERARRLAGDLGVRAVSAPVPADLLVNCTSVGLERGAGVPAEAAQRSEVERSATEDRALNQLSLTFDQVGEYSDVIDLVYRPGSTPLLAAARAHGARTVDGLEVLVAQGALSLQLWTGRPAPIEVMRRAARQAV
jgi:shikimate dehydrogenase